jgi:hypothetical protein
MTQFAVSPANFLDWQKQSDVFTGMALYGAASYEITGTGKAETIQASAVTSSFFSVLDVQPIHGRAFLPEEDQPGRNKEIVLSYKLWQSRYGADPNVVGKSITLDGTPYLIVGVMGPKMNKPDFAEAWTPLGLTAEQAAVRGDHNFLSIARLKPGVTIQQAQAAMNTISQRLEQAYPADDKGWGASVISLRDDVVGDVRPALLMMLGAVAFVLLIACANVSNLIFARVYGRRKEVAIRSALGATRARIIQPLLTESILIAICGGAFGLLLAHFGIELLLKFFADKLPRMGEIGLSVPVLVFTVGLSIFTGLLSGFLPAWNLVKGDLNDSLKQGLGRLDADSSSSFSRSALVSIEVASPWSYSSAQDSCSAASGIFRQSIPDSIPATCSPSRSRYRAISSQSRRRNRSSLSRPCKGFALFPALRLPVQSTTFLLPADPISPSPSKVSLSFRCLSNLRFQSASSLPDTCLPCAFPCSKAAISSPVTLLMQLLWWSSARPWQINSGPSKVPSVITSSSHSSLTKSARLSALSVT